MNLCLNKGMEYLRREVGDVGSPGGVSKTAARDGRRGASARSSTLVGLSGRRASIRGTMLSSAPRRHRTLTVMSNASRAQSVPKRNGTSRLLVARRGTNGQVKGYTNCLTSVFASTDNAEVGGSIPSSPTVGCTALLYLYQRFSSKTRLRSPDRICPLGSGSGRRCPLDYAHRYACDGTSYARRGTPIARSVSRRWHTEAIIGAAGAAG